MSRTWGPGDTVGCGVDALRRFVFFTLNGELVGPLPLFPPSFPFIVIAGMAPVIEFSMRNNPVFPVLGLDTSDTVHVNFGREPFACTLHDLEEEAFQRYNGLVVIHWW